MTPIELTFIAIGLAFVFYFTVKLFFGKEEGGVVKRVGRWLRRVFDAFMGMEP